MEAEWISLVGSVGFPIVAWFWTMGKIDKSVQANTSAINELTTLIKRQCP